MSSCSSSCCRCNFNCRCCSNTGTSESKMYSNSNIDNKIRGIIFGIILNSNNEKSSHISIESQAPKWFLAGAVLGNKDRNHVYSGGEAVKTRQKTSHVCSLLLRGPPQQPHCHMNMSYD